MAIKYGPANLTQEPRKMFVKVTETPAPPTPIKVSAIIQEVEPKTIKTVLAIYENDAPKKGRPPSGKAKKAVTIRLDQDVAAALEAREDWRNEVNAVLRRHLGL